MQDDFIEWMRLHPNTFKAELDTPDPLATVFDYARQQSLSEKKRKAGGGLGGRPELGGPRHPTDKEKKEAREAEIQRAVAREIEKFFPGRKITSPEDVEKRRKEREEERERRAQAPKPTLHPSLDEPLDPEVLRGMTRPSN